MHTNQLTKNDLIFNTKKNLIKWFIATKLYLFERCAWCLWIWKWFIYHMGSWRQRIYTKTDREDKESR